MIPPRVDRWGRAIAPLVIACLVATPAGSLRAASGATPRTRFPAPRKAEDPRLEKAYKFQRDGWIYVHLEGSPHDIGFQHGYLLASQIADAFGVVKLEMMHDTGRDWDFYRRAARQMLWPKIDPEYQAELQGIVDGLQAQKTKLDLDDIVAFNGWSELPDYYVPYLENKTNGKTSRRQEQPTHCSAFVATGSWTSDGGIVMAHNNWTTYMEGARWNIIFDIAPEQGNRFMMDGFPGAIASDDDFGVNSAGMIISETTMSNFHGFDPNGKAEFVRARKAMQYSKSIDDFMQIMLDRNNGGYANDWLLGDDKTGEIARFELGLQHHNVWRTKDGYYSGANFPSDPEVIRDETTFNPNDAGNSANARRVRWDQLLVRARGKIDAKTAETFLGDHYDAYTQTDNPDQRTICSHYDTAPVDPGDPGAANHSAYGAVQGKAIDSRMAKNMSFAARIGHPCGTKFDAAKYISEHPEYSWETPILRDMVAGPWTFFRSGDHGAQ